MDKPRRGESRMRFGPWNASFAPLGRADFSLQLYPRLAPWALFLRRFAAGAPLCYFGSGAGVCVVAGCDVVNATLSAPPVESRVRYGKNGVISNSIFSRADSRATGLALESST